MNHFILSMLQLQFLLVILLENFIHVYVIWSNPPLIPSLSVIPPYSQSSFSSKLGCSFSKHSATSVPFHSVLPMCSRVLATHLEHGQPLRSQIPEEIRLALPSCRMPIAPRLGVRLPESLPRLCWVSGWLGFVHAVMAAVNSWAQWQCHARKKNMSLPSSTISDC